MPAAVTAHPDELTTTRWLQADDFTLPLHHALFRGLTTLAHRGEPIDPVTVVGGTAPRPPHRRPHAGRPHGPGIGPGRLAGTLG
ncbi:DnaB-like helicase N-terminal domain-containing protein [Streptomyces mobaraensis]|uniref:DnaB-like helicase N-terminal domain-containing protein n=1 Tax=Streptomyces mobaraensis TaxID=35621 RepID=UPI001F183BA4|nr:DnaB-like helicase N-terminal domain-containing protein [Streptomyces mobaraensis]